MLNRTFLVDAGIRVLRTFAQVLIGALGLDGAGVTAGTWHEAFAVALSAAFLSALTQLAAVTGGEEANKLAASPSATPSASREAPGPVINPNG